MEVQPLGLGERRGLLFNLRRCFLLFYRRARIPAPISPLTEETPAAKVPLEHTGGGTEGLLNLWPLHLSKYTLPERLSSAAVTELTHGWRQVPRQQRQASRRQNKGQDSETAAPET